MKTIPLELYVPDLDIATPDSINVKYDITAVPDQERFLATLEDKLDKIDAKYAKGARQGGKRITVALAKHGNIRERTMRFIPYPALLIHRIDRLRPRVFELIRPYVSEVEVERVGRNQGTRFMRLVSKQMIEKVIQEVDRANATLVAEVRDEMSKFETTPEFNDLFSFINSHVQNTNPVPHISYPPILLSFVRPGIFDGTFTDYLDNAHARAIAEVEAEKARALKHALDDVERNKNEMITKIQGDVVGRMETMTTRIADLLEKIGKRGAGRSSNSLIAKLEQLDALSESFSLTGVSPYIQRLEAGVRAINSRDETTAKAHLRDFVTLCGISSSGDLRKDLETAVSVVKGQKSLFLSTIS